MIRQKEKRMLLTMVLIAAVFVMGVGMKVAHAGYLKTSAEQAAMAGGYQGLSQMYSSLTLMGGSSAYLYDAYSYMGDAKTYAYNAYIYAGYASGSNAYYAYTYAVQAYDYFVQGETNAHYAYLYNSTYYTYFALYYGGAGGVYIGLAAYYAV